MIANPFECKACTGPLEICGDQGRCTYCGEVQPIPKANESLFNRANRLRCENQDFDAAMKMYEQIVLEWPNEAEAYWGLVLCRYGIEYVADGGGQVPTCHRTILASILQDTDYRAAVDHAEGETRAYYEKQGRLIDAYQKKINQIAAQERPYDVFISFKANDGDGGTTDDSFLAQQLFNCLTQKLGLRVFFSKYTLRDKAGSEFEPIIFAALSSAKVMILVATKSEYLRAPWVKNEWSRFLGMMNEPSAGKKWLIPALKGMKPSELPMELSRFQAVDLGGFDALNELCSNIDLRLGSERVKGEGGGGVSAEATARALRSLEIETQLEAGNRYLGAGDFSMAVEHFSKAIEIDPTSSSAYWGRFLASRSVPNAGELFRKGVDLSTEADFQTALRFAKTPAEKGRCEQVRLVHAHLLKYGRAHKALLARLRALVKDLCEGPSDIDAVEGFRKALQEYLPDQGGSRGVQGVSLVAGGLFVLASPVVWTFSDINNLGAYTLLVGMGLLGIGGAAYLLRRFEVRSKETRDRVGRARLDESFEKLKAYVHSEIDRNNREFENVAPQGTPGYFVYATNLLDKELDAAFARSLRQGARE